MYWILLILLILPIPRVMASETISIPVLEDTYIEEKFPTIAPWSARVLYLGTDSWYAKGKNRILIKPDFVQLQDRDILYTDIEKVELVMTLQTYQGTKGEVTIDTYTTTLPWTMYTATWETPLAHSSSKEDSSVITTSYGKKNILVSNTFHDVYGGYPSLDRGILLKVNAETEKALIFWANGCDVAQITSPCGSISDRPYFKVTYRNNVQPSTCKLKYPEREITNSSTIEIEPLPSVDADSTRPVNYVARVCHDITCENNVWQGSVYIGKKTSLTLEDNNYYISCQATDGHQGAEWGDIKQLRIDTVPPQPPAIIEEPLYTSSTENRIFWFPETEEVEYQVITSERSNFSSYNSYSSWTKENSTTFTHLKEKTFYYRVRSRDEAGNESLWSNITSTTLDTTYPAVKYFKANKTLVSPRQLPNGSIEGNAYIQGGSDEVNIDTLRLEIRNQVHNVIHTQETTDKSYLWTHWPDNNGYEDGNYFAVFYIADSVGHVSVSDPLFFIIDTTPPSPAHIEGISPNQTLNKTTFQFRVTCPTASSATVYLSGKIIAAQKQSHFLQTTKKDGSYTLKTVCTDEAGNKSERSIHFNVDTTPPNIPAITYTHDTEKKLLTLKVYCREDGTVTFFRSGIVLKSFNCKKNAYATFSEQNLVYPYFNSFTVNMSDTSGNRSDLAEKTIFLSSSKDMSFKPVKIICTAVLFLEERQFKETYCNTKEEDLFRYVNTTLNSKDIYASSLEVRRIESALITTTVFGCKSKTFWDPRTWVGCVQSKLQEITTDVLVTPHIKSSDTVINQDQQRVLTLHPKKDHFEMNYQLYFNFSLKVGEETFSHHFTTEQRRQVIVPHYQNNAKKAYFSWIFKAPKQVNQWHGNTAYEKPHSGIDFAVSNEQILAPEKGKVVVATYHKGSRCNSGGNYVGIKHPNGLYTYYFHLKSSKYTVNKSVEKGEVIATSGNSGKYNCEPLAAHLHFEVRTSMAGNAHINPVPYFGIDWNTIKTAKIDKFPKRLSGENPHPEF